MFIKRSLKVFVIAIVAFAFASVATAYAAANTVDKSGAGQGAGDISGYDITAIHYKLLATDPSKIQSVTFMAAPTLGVAGVLTGTSDVFVKIDGVASDRCALTGVWTCDFPGPLPTVIAAGSLIVIAVE